MEELALSALLKTPMASLLEVSAELRFGSVAAGHAFSTRLRPLAFARQSASSALLNKDFVRICQPAWLGSPIFTVIERCDDGKSWTARRIRSTRISPMAQICQRPKISLLFSCSPGIAQGYHAIKDWTIRLVVPLVGHKVAKPLELNSGGACRNIFQTSFQPSAFQHDF